MIKHQRMTIRRPAVDVDMSRNFNKLAFVLLLCLSLALTIECVRMHAQRP